MSERIISLDFETFYSTKLKYGLKQLGYRAYARDEKFDPYMISVWDGTQGWAGPPSEFNWDALDGATIAAHNAAFDEEVQIEMVNRGWAPRLINPWLCTANLSSYVCNRRSLADASQFLLGVRLDKSARSNADGKHATDLKAEGSWSSMVEYALSDSKHCWELANRFVGQWPAHERRLSDLTIRQGRRGIQIDTELLAKYTQWLEEAKIRTEEKLPWIKSGKKPTSTIAIAEQCRASNIPCPPVKKDEGEEAYDEWETKYSPHFAWVKAFSDWRQVNKLLAFMKTVKTRMDFDGVLSFSLKYFGAHTGRWSGDTGLNMQNLRSDPLYLDANFAVTVLQLAVYTIDVRALFVARSGRKLIVCDLSQIEPRVLSWMVGDKRKLDLMAAGFSPYEALARADGSWTRDESLKACREPEAKKLYKMKKAQELGLGYQCGWEKFIKVAFMMAGYDATEGDPEFIQAENIDGDLCFNSDGSPKMVSGYGYNSKKTVREWRESNPLVAHSESGIWARLDAAFKQCVGGNFEMELPSGRKMIYRDIQQQWKTTQGPDGKFKKKLVFTADIGGKRVGFYGGKLTENAVQATARDAFGKYLLDLDDSRGIDVLFSSHDEAITETDMDVSAKDVEHIMTRPIDWLNGCPIAAEAKETPHYLK